MHTTARTVNLIVNILDVVDVIPQHMEYRVDLSPTQPMVKSRPFPNPSARLNRMYMDRTKQNNSIGAGVHIAEQK